MAHRIACALALGLVMLPWSRSNVPAWGLDSNPPRPNVLLIVSDDQRPDTIHALGNEFIRTPNLDRLARRGIAFTHAVAPCPICTPSRAELLSGCTIFHCGVTNFGGRFKPDLVLWPEAMRRAGYRTWYCGKWHNDGRPSTRGYDASRGLFAGGGRRFARPATDYRGHPVTGYVGWVFQTDDGKLEPQLGVGLTPHTNRHIADAAISFLREKQTAPFFLHVNFTAPHDPLLPPRNKAHHYDPRTIPLPPNFAPQHPFDHGNLHGRDEELLPFPRTPDIVRADRAMYYAVISDLDEQVGRLLQTLQETGLCDSTIVIYTSDHGLAVGSHGLRGKQNMYEHTVGVPLLIAGPGIPAGRRLEPSVYLRDLYPTICQWCDVPCPDDLDGKSFASLLHGETKPIHPFIVGYFRHVQRMIRTDDWKLIVYPEAGRHQLFDMRHDRNECHDRAMEASMQPHVRRLAAMLRTWQRKHHDPLVVKIAP